LHLLTILVKFLAAEEIAANILMPWRMLKAKDVEKYQRKLTADPENQKRIYSYQQAKTEK
jgi:Zn-dependent peptidase ImmA (M78 family)